MKKKFLALILGMVMSLPAVGYCDNLYTKMDKASVTIEQSVKEKNVIREAIQKAYDSVVGIIVESLEDDDEGAVGSGVIVREDGYIITNNHVVKRALIDETINKKDNFNICVCLDPESKEDCYAAEVIKRDVVNDLAILKIKKTGLKAIEFADSDSLQRGDTTIAIGNPINLDLFGTVSTGIVSGLNRKIDFDDYVMKPIIQTTAPLSPGNSGGALLNDKGELIGVNALISDPSKYENINFAIPSNTAKEFCGDLLKKGA